MSAKDGPSFKNTMSAGDRNTLALAFFFASLDQDSNLTQKIVVIDDPMTSLDEHRSLATIQEVRGLVNRVRQIIILSHSKPFLCQIWEGVENPIRTALQIIRGHGSSSVIKDWDVTQDCITEHDKRYELIKQYLTQSDPSKNRKVAEALRYVLEAFLRVSYPTYFPLGKMLGFFLQNCQNLVKTDNLILNEGDIKELCQLKEHANKFHHDTNAAYATTIINDQELSGYCSRTLDFAKRPR